MHDLSGQWNPEVKYSSGRLLPDEGAIRPGNSRDIPQRYPVICEFSIFKRKNLILQALLSFLLQYFTFRFRRTFRTEIR